ncbi:MAG: alpha/beta hydrolase [Gammaproteobacteria bacterium]|nr:alpha/beta hydrolase [Gammaproteobacteria bacterium]
MRIDQLEVVVDHPEIELKSGPIAVLCHPHPLMQGTMNNKVVTTAARAFNQLGLITVRFNYRGVGKSKGEYGHIVGECEDLKTVVDWVRESYPGCDIWLAGFSFGSFIAYKMANNLGAKQLLCIAPAVNEIGYQDAEEPAMPWTLIVPDADEVVSVQNTFDWLRQVKCSYQLIKLAGVSHFFHGQLMVLKQLIVDRYSN